MKTLPVVILVATTATAVVASLGSDKIADMLTSSFEDTTWKSSKPASFCESYGRYVHLTRENDDGSVYVQCSSMYGDEIPLHADVTKTRTYQKL